MIIGGADMSGSDCKGDSYNHVSLLLGTEEIINKIHKKIGISHIHMRKLSKAKKLRVQHNLDLSSNRIRVWCFHIERQRTEMHIMGSQKLKNKKIPRASVHKNFEIHFLRTIRNEL